MLSRNDVDHVARLARLHLTHEEREQYTGELNEILGYVNKLEELDVSGIEPTAHVVPLQNVLRPDELKPSFERDRMLANAPEGVEGFFKVPKILEG